MQIDATQIAGLAGLAPAAVAAAVVSSIYRSHRRAWAIVATIHTLLAIEVLMMARHWIDRAIGAWLRGADLYTGRRPFQTALLIVIVLVAALLARRIFGGARKRRGDFPIIIATGATAALLLLFAIESVSLHAIDALLYQSAGPILLIGWLWLITGWTTTGAAIAALRR